MASTTLPEADSTAATIVGPLRDSFLRHLAAENRSRWTQVSSGAAIDPLAAFNPNHRRLISRREPDPTRGCGRAD